MIRDGIRPKPDERSAAVGDVDPGFGVYVHWPFCLSKCPYCDFNSHVRGKPIDEERYLSAFRAEIAHRASLAPGRARAPRSSSAAGRPPSCARRRCRASSTPSRPNGGSRLEAEITLEANPTSVEAGRFRAYRAAGVNRLSVGVQALNDADLRALGRKHTVDEAIAAVGLAASLFPRFTFDLIYGRPGQSEAQWRAELARALDLVGDHVSLYQLTIEPDTIFERLRDAGKLALPDEELGLALFTRDARADRSARPAGLRGLQPRPSRAARAATT